VLAGLFVPIGGLLLAHFVVARVSVAPEELYFGSNGEVPRAGLWSTAGVAAWAAGIATFYLAQPIGGVAPSLAVSIVVYVMMRHRTRVAPAPTGVDRVR
jgi:hypothetical protein